MVKRDRIKIVYELLCCLRDHPELVPTRVMGFMGIQGTAFYKFVEVLEGLGYIEKGDSQRNRWGGVKDKRTRFIWMLTDVGREVLEFLEGHPLGRWCVSE
jgi:predicted transcriptional regulator